MPPLQTSLPPALARPLVVDGAVAARLVLGVTTYLVGPTVEEFEALWSMYRRLCPPASRTLFKLDEFLTWSAFA